MVLTGICLDHICLDIGCHHIHLQCYCQPFSLAQIGTSGRQQILCLKKGTFVKMNVWNHCHVQEIKLNWFRSQFHCLWFMENIKINSHIAKSQPSDSGTYKPFTSLLMYTVKWNYFDSCALALQTKYMHITSLFLTSKSFQQKIIATLFVNTGINISYLYIWGNFRFGLSLVNKQDLKSIIFNWWFAHRPC